MPACLGDQRRVVVAAIECVGERNGFALADGGFHGAADGAARQAKEGGAVAAVIGAGDDEVDGREVLEKVVESELGAGCRGAVDENPFFFLLFLLFTAQAR